MLAIAYAPERQESPTRHTTHVVPDVLVKRPFEGLDGGAVRVVNAKDHVFREGDAASHVYIVEAGHLCIYRVLPDGRRQVMDFAYPGDIVGLGAIEAHGTNAQATERTRVRCFTLGDLREKAHDNAAFCMALYSAMSQELVAARELVVTVGHRTATEKVASFLMALSRRNARRGTSPNELVLPMTRSDIADFLGLTIETVSRTFTKFRHDEVIDLEQCVLVTIRDPRKLANLAGGTASGKWNA